MTSMLEVLALVDIDCLLEGLGFALGACTFGLQDISKHKARLLAAKANVEEAFVLRSIRLNKS